MVGSTEGSNSASGQETPGTPSSEVSSTVSPAQRAFTTVEIDARGDVILRIEHEVDTKTLAESFRVSSAALKANSKYFLRILEPGPFGEATKISEQHKRILDRYGNITVAPTNELPVLEIQDLGRISVKSVTALLTDFLHILHAKDTQTSLPVANLANLAIVADRFDALDAVKEYVQHKRMIQAIDGRTSQKLESGLSEEKIRQRLLVGTLLDQSPWVEKYSARLIIKGWLAKDVDISTALWWDLPSRIEEELEHRRKCVLETIQSLQSYFLALYTSRERQCKLGYDTSTQCDSFQLGEMMRFFTRIGTLQFRGTLVGSKDRVTPYTGDLNALLDTLRQAPEYQIDKNHMHCGIRQRILPLLDLLQECLQYVGICHDCWLETRVESAWINCNRPLLWKRQSFRLRGQGHHDRHTSVRALFTANERDWS